MVVVAVLGYGGLGRLCCPTRLGRGRHGGPGGRRGLVGRRGSGGLGERPGLVLPDMAHGLLPSENLR